MPWASVVRLELHRDEIRTIRGQNEEAMALAAVAYAKASAGGRSWP